MKNSARRLWRRDRLLHPEKDSDYAQALYHCAEAFFSVKSTTIQKGSGEQRALITKLVTYTGFRIALASSVSEQSKIQLPTRAKLRSPKNQTWKPKMPYITDGDVRKIKYKPRVVMSHPGRRGVGQKASEDELKGLLKSIKDAQELLKVICFH